MDELRQIALPLLVGGAAPIECEATTAVLSKLIFHSNPGTQAGQVSEHYKTLEVSKLAEWPS